MKLKVLFAALLGTLLLQPAAFAQTNADVTATPVVVADASATNAPGVTADAGITNAPGMVNPAEVPTNAPAMGAASGSPETGSAAGTPSVASIPLVQFQDVPLTTAIENLARQAGINYLLDPKIGYGQPDASGQVKAEPTLSIRWENITAEHALKALLDNYGLQLTTDSKTMIYRVTAKDPAALPPLVTRVIQLKYAGTTNMMESLQGTLTDKRSRVIADNRTSQLVVVATDPEQTTVDTLIRQLDMPPKQVLIETRLVELASNPTSRKGVDWSGTLAAQNISFGNNALPGIPPSTVTTVDSAGNVTTTPTAGTIGGILGTPGLLGQTSGGPFFNPATGFLNADGAHAVLSFLNESQDAQVTSTPRVVTLDNETASISVLRSVPILNSTAGTQGSPGGSSISYSNVGTVLLVTPRISANDTIRLKVTPTVSSFFGYIPLTASGASSSAPEFDSRVMDTQVLIPNANTLVMGGMVKDNPKNSMTKVPVLGDIPGLGALFRSSVKESDKDNLLIFITPTILQDTDFHPTTTDFLQAQPKTTKETLNPNNLWDGAKPYNWADPSKTDPNVQILDQKATQ